MVRVKICGVRRVEEAEAALSAGAEFLGFVFYPPSPRYLDPADASALLQTIRGRMGGGHWAAVGVFVNAPSSWVNELAVACGLDYVQLHGTEPLEYCARMQRPVIKALRLVELDQRGASAEHHGAARVLIDSQVPGLWGGTGARFDWQAARPHASEAFVAGGLTPGNVREAIATLRPWGLDVSSGVERGGVKDLELIRAFLENARRGEESDHGD